jgi:hypothetical protein
MLKSRRIASARPPPGGAVVSSSESRRFAARAHELLRALLDGFKRHDLLTYASAISFQILTAIIPFLLFVLGVAGSLHLNYVWRDHLEPQLRGSVSSAVFAVIENAVNNVFASRQVLWATVGGGLALWQVSGAVRAVMGALARIYGASAERSFVRRYLISFVLSIEVGACFTLTALPGTCSRSWCGGYWSWRCCCWSLEYWSVTGEAGHARSWLRYLFAAGFGRVALGRDAPESRILIWAHRLRRADRPRVSG